MNALGLPLLGVWTDPDELPIEEAHEFAAAVERHGFGALWVAETLGRDPFVVLATIAERTDSLVIGTCVASIWARDATAMRMAAMTLHELSAGRFVLGLGASHRHLVEVVRGHPYERPLERMRAFLDEYRRAPYRANPAPQSGQPDVILGAVRERMVDLAARETAGAFPSWVTAPRLLQIRAQLDRAVPTERPFLGVTLAVVAEADGVDARDTARVFLRPYLGAVNYQASWAEQGFTPADWRRPGSDRLVEAMAAWGTDDEILDRLVALRRAGADHIAIIPVSNRGTTDSRAALERVAGLAGQVL